MTASGCTVCWRHMVSSAMFLNPPAFSSTAAPDGPRRTGSMRTACCACLRPISGVITKPAAWCACQHPEEEDAKRTHREREKLVQERLRIENRIEALLFTQGIRKRPSLRSWERDLAVLRTGDGREIPRHLRAELDRLRRRLVMTLELIREVEAERDQAAKTKPQDQACHKIAALSLASGVLARTSPPCSRVRYSIVHSTTAGRSQATSASHQCPTRAAVWIAIGGSAGPETRGQGRL